MSRFSEMVKEAKASGALKGLSDNLPKPKMPDPPKPFKPEKNKVSKPDIPEPKIDTPSFKKPEFSSKMNDNSPYNEK